MHETKPRHGTAYLRVRTVVRVALGAAGLVALLAAASWADGPLHHDTRAPGCVAPDVPGPCVWRGDDMGATRSPLASAGEHVASAGEHVASAGEHVASAGEYLRG
jgi:hypothetical protein